MNNPDTYEANERAGFEGADATDPVMRISIRLQAALNYAISCELLQHGGIDGKVIEEGIAHGLGTILQMYHSNCSENETRQKADKGVDLIVSTVLASAMQVKSGQYMDMDDMGHVTPGPRPS